MFFREGARGNGVGVPRAGDVGGGRNSRKRRTGVAKHIQMGVDRVLDRGFRACDAAAFTGQKLQKERASAMMRVKGFQRRRDVVQSADGQERVIEIAAFQKMADCLIHAAFKRIEGSVAGPGEIGVVGHIAGVDTGH